MNSFCIKTNNKKMINYLLDRFNKSDIDVYISNLHFKIYENVIVHYKGTDVVKYHNLLCDVIADCILKFYEDGLLKEIINSNYFYFSEPEKRLIFDNCTSHLEQENTESNVRKEHLYVAILKYITEKNSVILDGFVNFRIKDYSKILDYVVDLSVNKFLIEKEYSEFISLLKMYVDSKNSTVDQLHLIYYNNESIIIDDEKNIISTDDNIFNAKYLCDISFSSNDYALNTLLTIIPQKIIIHVLDQEDDFIHTLKLIFSDRIHICQDCSICNNYKFVTNSYIRTDTRPAPTTK